MSSDPTAFECLSEHDTGILEKQGWHFVTYFQTRQEGKGSSAYNKASAKASAHKRQAGLRNVLRDGVTYWEIWEHW